MRHTSICRTAPVPLFFQHWRSGTPLPDALPPPSLGAASSPPSIGGMTTASDPATPHVLLIAHGLLGSAQNWGTAARQLSAALGPSVHVVAADMRNHGRSPHAQVHHSAALAYDMRALLEGGRLDGALGSSAAASAGSSSSSGSSEVKERRLVVMGHSMGGLAAMTLLLQQARRRYSASFAAMLRERYGEAEANEQLAAGAALVSSSGDAGDATAVTEATRIGEFTLAGSVVVDVTPTQRTIDSINEIGQNIAAMRAMPLRDSTTQKPIARSAAEAFLKSYGISNAATRAFLMTNLTAGHNPEWRCNLDVLQHLSQLRFPYAPHDSTVDNGTCSTQSCAIQAVLNPEARSAVPVQFIFGSESPYNVADGRDAIAEYFEDFEEFVVPKSGHNPHYERRDDFVAATVPFLKQQFRID